MLTRIHQPAIQAVATAMRPEVELLLLGARTRMDEASTARLRVLLQHDLDWDYLIPTAFRHGVLPLLAQNLQTIYPEAVPTAVVDRLRSNFHANAQHALFLTGELLKLLQLLERQGISAVPYKGPVLAATVYGNPVLRQFADLDILVPKRDVLRAKALLLSQHYHLMHSLQATPDTVHLRARGDFPMVRDDGRVVVDLHWAITQRHCPFPLEMERVWERLEQVCLTGTQVRNLAPEDLLLILCVHGAKHGWERLAWICDIAALLRRYAALDWESVLTQAHTLRSQRRLLLGLHLAHTLGGTPLPIAVVRRVQADSVVPALAKQVHDRLFAETASMLHVLEHYLFPARTLERPQDTMRYLLHLARQRLRPTADDRALLALPTWLSCLYYPLRLLRLASLYGVTLPSPAFHKFWQLLRGR